jgi:hypothetical protein
MGYSVTPSPASSDLAEYQRLLDLAERALDDGDVRLAERLLAMARATKPWRTHPPSAPSAS